jgi:hypothetical protein
MKQLASTVLVACLVGCATPRAERPGSITVIQRHGYAICAGYCPNLDVVVREDGLVTLSRGYPRPLQVSVKQAAQFVRTLNPYRPTVREAGPATCGSWNTADPLVVKVLPYEIIWTDADGSTFRLRSCGDPGLGEAIRQAFWSIGLYQGGEPR